MLGGRVAGQELQRDLQLDIDEILVAPGQWASSNAISWFVAAVCMATMSSRVRTTVTVD